LAVAIVAGMFLHSCWAQDLAPRAYLITPVAGELLFRA
jgi:hypothetical protein